MNYSLMHIKLHTEWHIYIGNIYPFHANDMRATITIFVLKLKAHNFLCYNFKQAYFPAMLE